MDGIEDPKRSWSFKRCKLRCLIHEDLPLQLPKVFKEALEQPDSMMDIIDAARLADTVHTQLRVPQVQRPSPQTCRQHGPNGAPAARIVAHDEQLQRHLVPSSDFLDQCYPRRIGRVASVGVDLDHGALVHLGLVIVFVLGRVVWVHRMRHIRRHEEGCRERLLICRFRFLAPRRPNDG